jgi:hypothetical protein
LVFDIAELAFADHVHDRDANDQDSSATKGLETEHRPGDAFDGAVVSLDELVQVLRLAHLDGQAAVGLDAPDRCRVRATLVYRDLLGHTVQVNAAFEECSCSSTISLGTQKEVDGVAVAINCPVQALPRTADLHVGFAHPPTQADWARAPTERGRQHRQHLDRPAGQRGVIDEDAALGHHFLNVAKAQRTGRVPARAPPLLPAGSANAEPLG